MKHHWSCFRYFKALLIHTIPSELWELLDLLLPLGIYCASKEIQVEYF
jgi:hypothetical protein